MKIIFSKHCPLCKSKKYRIIYKSNLKKTDYDIKVIENQFKNSLSDFSKHGQIVKCTKCNLIYTNPVENTDLILKSYENVIDVEYIETEKYRKMLSSQHLIKIRKFIDKGDLLDVGCFCGFFLEIAREKGFNTFGVEPSNWASSIARKHGARILGKTLNDIKSKKFNIITMFDVIEHLQDPILELKLINKKLKPNGLIVIGTPNIESFFVKTLKNKHPFFIRMHIVLFGTSTIEKALKISGFTPIFTSSYSRTYPLGYFLIRITNVFPSLRKILTIIKPLEFLKRIPITIWTQDEMLIIAKKN